MRISLTGHLITLPLSVDRIISSSFDTTRVDVTFPFLFELIIPIIPFPPLLVTLNSEIGVLFPYPFSVIDKICLSMSVFLDPFFLFEIPFDL